jgi:hypothetical protein
MVFLAFALALALWPAVGPFTPRATAQEKKTAKKESGGTAKKDKEKKSEEEEEGEGSGKQAEASKSKGKDEGGKSPSIDEKYVLDNLKTYLNATEFEALPDGRVKIVLDLSEKKDEWVPLFQPKVEKEMQKQFRWSIGREETYFRGYVNGHQWTVGLRIANQGAAHLNCWFTDDVEAEVDYIQATSVSAQQSAAVVFTNASGKSLGSNFGTQCTTYASGVKKSGKGPWVNLNSFNPAKFKLVVKSGSFEAHRDGKKQETAEYKGNDYASGRIGFIWAGGMAAYFHRLAITGRVDVKKMAAQMKAGK